MARLWLILARRRFSINGLFVRLTVSTGTLDVVVGVAPTEFVFGIVVATSGLIKEDALFGDAIVVVTIDADVVVLFDKVAAEVFCN